MKKEPVGIPQNMIISNTWDMYTITKFMQGLSKDTLFGYSGAFTLEEVKRLANRNGVGVKTLAPSSPLRKKFGENVLKVTEPYVLPKVPVRYYYNYHHIEFRHSLGNRKCHNLKCQATIAKGDLYLQTAKLVPIPAKVDTTGYEKKSYCRACGISFVKQDIKNLLNMLPVDKDKVKQITQQVNDL